MPEITIYHDDGTTDTIPGAVSRDDEPAIDFTNQFEDMTTLKVRVLRDDLSGVTLERKRDELEVDGWLRGPLTNVKRLGSIVELTANSPEWYASNTQPLPGGLRLQGDVQTILTDLIDRVDELSVGTIDNTASNLTFVFSHAFPNEAMGKVERNVPGNLRFRSDGTVDFLSPAGDDLTGDVEVSAAAGTAEGDPEVIERSRSEDATHLRVVGAHEGEAQVAATVVPESDSATYPDRVNYTNPDWNDGDPRDWDRYENVDVLDEATIAEEGKELIEELREPFLKIRTWTTGLNASLGDTVDVAYPSLTPPVDAALRVVEVRRTLDSGTDRKRVTLSNRQKTDEGDIKFRRDLQRFNVGFQGASVSVQGGGSRQPVDSSINAEIPFDYPDLQYENEATVQIRGLSYRAYSAGAADGGGAFVSSNSGGTNDDTTESGGGEFLTSEGGGGFSETTTSNAQSEHGSPDSDSDTGFTPLVGSSSWVQIAQPVVSEFEVEGMFGGAFVRNADEFEEDIRFRINVGNGDSYWPSFDGARVCAAASQDSGGGTIPATGSATAFAPVEDGSYELEILYDGSSGEANVAWWYTALGDHSHDVTVSRPDHVHDVDIPSHQHQFDWLHDHTVDVPDHTHPVDPGIIETGDTPSNVDVIVNGTTVATNVGSGFFETEVDISGEMNPDAWNDIEVTSDSLGHVQANVSLDGYKQIGGNTDS